MSYACHGCVMSVIISEVVSCLQTNDRYRMNVKLEPNQMGSWLVRHQNAATSRLHVSTTYTKR